MEDSTRDERVLIARVFFSCSDVALPAGLATLRELPVRSAVAHHFLAIGMKRVVDDPLGGV